MLGSEKQIKWALSIQNNVINKINDNFPLHEKLISIYEGIDDASWWISMRDDFNLSRFILVFGLVSLAQDGSAKACDEVVKLQNDFSLAPLFNKFKVNYQE